MPRHLARFAEGASLGVLASAIFIGVFVVLDSVESVAVLPGAFVVGLAMSGVVGVVRSLAVSVWLCVMVRFD